MKFTSTYFTYPAFIFGFTIGKSLLDRSTNLAVSKSTEITISGFLQILVVFAATITKRILRSCNSVIFACQGKYLIIMSIIKLKILSLDINIKYFVSLFERLYFLHHQLNILETTQCLSIGLQSTQFLKIFICPELIIATQVQLVKKLLFFIFAVSNRNF